MGPPGKLDFAGVLARLIGFQKQLLIVSMGGVNETPPVFLFFDSVLTRGRDNNMGTFLGHDKETFELEFENGTTLTIDPTHVTSARWSESESGAETLRFIMGGIEVIMTHDPSLTESGR